MPEINLEKLIEDLRKEGVEIETEKAINLIKRNQIICN
jgi:hypothetical protein